MKKLLSVAIIICLIFADLSVFAEGEASNNAVNGFNDVLDVTLGVYYKDITREELLQSAVNELLKAKPELMDELAKGAYKALDENSAYLTDFEYEERVEDVSKQFCGIGVGVSYLNNKVIISKVYKNTPAIAAGLMDGDIIVAVNGEDISSYNLEKVVSLIRGEEGTNVLLTVKRNGAEFYFTVPRAMVSIPSVEYEKLDKNNSGYIKIDSFSMNTATEFNVALGNLSSQGVDKIILDLRNNGGGYLSAAVKCAYAFVPNGKAIVTEDYLGEKNDKTYYSAGEHERMKVVVLVNEYTASASEVLTGAIMDNKAGVVVGTQTFGKGTVQNSWDLLNAGALWVTIAQYNLPSGKNIHGVGITPDYVVQNTTKAVDLTKFTPITKEKVLKYGDVSPQVLAIKQHLTAIGFTFISMDENFDDELVNAVTAIQSATGLYPYGVADITTQGMILSKAGESLEIIDNQLEKAKELIYNMK